MYIPVIVFMFQRKGLGYYHIEHRALSIINASEILKGIKQQNEYLVTL